jgi:hypothetical protein
VLRGDLVDQAALHGVLERVSALGLALLDLRKLAPADDWDTTPPG